MSDTILCARGYGNMTMNNKDRFSFLQRLSSLIKGDRRQTHKQISE